MANAASVCRCACIALIIFLFGQAAMADDLRIRITWGGGSPHCWHGTIAVSEGSLAEPRPLGIEADETGSMWLDAPAGRAAATLVVRQRSPRSHDGVDLLVSSPLSAKLLVRLSDHDDTAEPPVLEIPLADLIADSISKPLSDRGDRLMAARTPGDSLRVRLERDNLVFAPGEKLKLTLEPHHLPLPKSGAARIKVQFLADGKELSSQQYDIPSDKNNTIPLEATLPNQECVYDVVISVINNATWSQAVRQPLNWKRSLAERRVQALVLDPRRPSTADGPNSRSSENGTVAFLALDGNFTTVAEIDPANPRWYEKLNGRLNKLPTLPIATSHLPRWLREPLGNDSLHLRRHALGELAELAANAESPDVSWEAYRLPIAQIGRPHSVEVDYPSDVPQTLGLCVVEQTSAGTMTPIGIASCVDNTANEDEPDGSPRWRRHRLIFWPRSTTPLLLVINGRDRTPATFGKIRLLSGGERLPRALPEKVAANGRLLAAYLDRPLIPENFASADRIDSWSGCSLNDWTTFREGGTRLVECLHHAGYNGLMVGVLADGSTIYPSSLVEPTPRYDTGAFFATGQDPVRKDVLEMLFRLFDRDDLQLIPSLEFAAPLPELEAIRRAGGSEADGLEWIGADGAARSATWPPRRGLAPYYNVLDPRVQQAMLRVVHELAARYAQHPSFTGLALRLSADGYAQLPGPEWGLDDATIARFERDAHLRVPGQGARRFADRAAFLAEDSNSRAWLEWRAAQLARFYRRIYAELASLCPEAKLYLAGAGMMDGPEWEAELRPTLPRRTSIAETLLRAGIDARTLRDDQGQIVLLRPEHIAPRRDLRSGAVQIEVGQMADIDRYFQAEATTGGLFYHEPSELQIPSFDRKSPHQPSETRLISHTSPSGSQNRRRFVHALATLDAQVLVDGGSALPMSQEQADRDVVAAYRRLPAVRFQPVAGGQTSEAARAATFRVATYHGRTYLYAVNDAPFSATARVHIEVGQDCLVEELTGSRKIDPFKPDASSGMSWEVKLEPYDLVAIRMSEPDVPCSRPSVVWPGGVEDAVSSRIRRLGARAAALRNPPPLDAVANADFEREPTEKGEIPDWAVSVGKDVNVELDKKEKHGGRQSAKIASAGPVACLVSKPLVASATGRVSISAWLRTADTSRPPPLRVALEGKLHGRDFYRFAPVSIAADWGQYVLQIDDLPLEGLTELRARFDLMGPGEVWVDDVQVFSLAFSRSEMVELSKIITLADVRLQNGQVGDCLHLLEGYWPRFLEQHVPLATDRPREETAAAKPLPPPGDKPSERSSLLNRVKDLIPDSLRR